MAKKSAILSSLTRLGSTLTTLEKRAEKVTDSSVKAEAKIRLTIVKAKIAGIERALGGRRK